jgi:hypothetical protein
VINTRIPGNRRRSGFSGARRLTTEEIVELRRCNLPREGDENRRAGIEEMRQALQDRFGGDPVALSEVF